MSSLTWVLFNGSLRRINNETVDYHVGIQYWHLGIIPCEYVSIFLRNLRYYVCSSGKRRALIKVGQRSSLVLRFTIIKLSTVAWPPSSSFEGAGMTDPIIKSLEDCDYASANRHSKGASSSKSILYAIIIWEKTFDLVGRLSNPFVSSLFLE